MALLYQTVSEPPPQNVTPCVPIFSKQITQANAVTDYEKRHIGYRPWLGDGYYFWEGFKSHAHHWGKTHCGGAYAIYTLEYIYGVNAGCLNLVDNPDHIELIERIIGVFVKSKSRKPELLSEVIYFFRASMKSNPSSKKFDSIRTLAEGGMDLGGDQILHFDKANGAVYHIKRQIQVCFWQRNGCFDRIRKIFPEARVSEDIQYV